jgi:hypothetical protein
VREIRMLRAMWRGLETEPRTSPHGHEGGNSGHRQGMPYGPPRQPSTLPTIWLTTWYAPVPTWLGVLLALAGLGALYLVSRKHPEVA